MTLTATPMPWLGTWAPDLGATCTGAPTTNPTLTITNARANQACVASFVVPS